MTHISSFCSHIVNNFPSIRQVRWCTVAWSFNMDFIGLQMVVTLRNPPGAQLKGTVSEVTPGQSLVLSNGKISVSHLLAEEAF